MENNRNLFRRNPLVGACPGRLAIPLCQPEDRKKSALQPKAAAGAEQAAQAPETGTGQSIPAPVSGSTPGDGAGIPSSMAPTAGMSRQDVLAGTQTHSHRHAGTFRLDQILSGARDRRYPAQGIPRDDRPRQPQHHAVQPCGAERRLFRRSRLHRRRGVGSGTRSRHGLDRGKRGRH